MAVEILEYRLTRDTLFKILFVRYPLLLINLVASVLGIPEGAIKEFAILNPEMVPEKLNDKFCHLDLRMTVDGKLVNLEVQVRNEGNFWERSLFYLTKTFSSALLKGEKYSKLPQVVCISILDFILFRETDEFRSEFGMVELKRQKQPPDHLKLIFFELPKSPETLDPEDLLGLWLSLFRAKTPADLERIEALGVKIMIDAITAYREVVASVEFKEAERMREMAEHDEAQALHHAREEERERWKTVVARKDEVVARMEEEMARKDEENARLQSEMAQIRAELDRFKAELTRSPK